ncbi:MAG: antibiotic biosynthesis monooxygenase, partial [Bacteroidia bacterium]|nr:antibiotic biosynthesis monooxygenase [Bacteroidia bacterium]
MIIRIVKMSFKPELVNDFLLVFNANKNKIRNFEGCKHLSLLQQTDEPNVLFTYSHWNSEKDLENYRNSELFKNTWIKTKILFNKN